MIEIIYHVLKEQRTFYSDKKEFQIQSVATPALWWCGGYVQKLAYFGGYPLANRFFNFSTSLL